MVNIKCGPKLLILCVTMTALSLQLASAGHELDNRDLDRGRSLYMDTCASCHGNNLEGQENWQVPNEGGTMPAPPHDQFGHTWHHDNRLLFEYTALGGAAALAERGLTDFKSGMPGFAADLTEEQIWNILAFIRSTWPQRIQDIQAGRQPPHN